MPETGTRELHCTISTPCETIVTSVNYLHWYVAVLVFESSIADDRSNQSIDIQFRLVRTTDADDAYSHAL